MFDNRNLDATTTQGYAQWQVRRPIVNWADEPNAQPVAEPAPLYGEFNQSHYKPIPLTKMYDAGNARLSLNIKFKARLTGGLIIHLQQTVLYRYCNFQISTVIEFPCVFASCVQNFIAGKFALFPPFIALLSNLAWPAGSQ